MRGEPNANRRATHRRWREVAAPFCGWAAKVSSDRSAKTVTPRGVALYAGWNTPRACRLRDATDGTITRMLGGPWVKHKIKSERVAATMIRARIADLRS